MAAQTTPGRHLLLTRDPDGGIRLGACALAVDAADLADVVLSHEQTGPRWVWDSTATWYPALLAGGVRVQRCVDLHLCHQILRRSPGVEQHLLDGPDSDRWDAGAADVVPSDPGSTLFDLALSAPPDSLAEWQRQQAAVAGSAHPARLRLLLAAESASALAAAEMTHAGVPWRADLHDALLTDLLGPRPLPGRRPERLSQLAGQVREALDSPTLDPDSPVDLLAALQLAGLRVSDTRSWRLAGYDHPVVGPLLAYKKLSRLHQANGWSWLDTWVTAGRFRPRYRPSGVPTGRWSSHGGGALSLPAQVRPAVHADPGWQLVVADLAQLEPRCLAAMSGDRALADAARGADLYQGLVDTGAVPTRDNAKLGLLGAMYGGTQGESGRMATRLADHYPTAFGLVEQAARSGEDGGTVSTWLGRGSAEPSPDWYGPDLPSEQQRQRRRGRGRFTRNFVVQGTGAELAACWLALLRSALWDLGGTGDLTDRPHLVFFLHDEVVVHAPEHLAAATAQALATTAARAGEVVFGVRPVDFPVSVAVVERYSDVGGKGRAAPT